MTTLRGNINCSVASLGCTRASRTWLRAPITVLAAPRGCHAVIGRQCSSDRQHDTDHLCVAPHIRSCDTPCPALGIVHRRPDTRRRSFDTRRRSVAPNLLPCVIVLRTVACPSRDGG